MLKSYVTIMIFRENNEMWRAASQQWCLVFKLFPELKEATSAKRYHAARSSQLLLPVDTNLAEEEKECFLCCKDAAHKMTMFKKRKIAFCF